jgi:hypothetical protein
LVPKNQNSVTKKKKIDHVPVVKPNVLKKKKWKMIENSLEIFPRWAAPPQINGIKYSNFYEMDPASEYDLTDVPLHQERCAVPTCLVNLPSRNSMLLLPR